MMNKTKKDLMREHPHFFSKSNMEFFDSQIEYVGIADVNGDDWFVTSEYDKYGATNYKRVFSVRRANASVPDRIHTVGLFCGFANLHDAITALSMGLVAVALAKGVEADTSL